MSADEEKALVGVDKAKHMSWKFFGAMFMETKEGVQAVSFHKVLGLLTYMLCVGFWTLSEARVAPDQVFYLMCGLIGLKGVSKVLESRKA